MLKIKKLKISIIDENEERWGNYFCFPEKLVAIIGENTVGKSTIVNSIYYALGMEELLGYKNSKALKPVLKDKIVVNKGKNEVEKEISIKESSVFLEIENIKGKKVTLKRAMKSSTSISDKIISVYFSELETINTYNKKDYFLDKNSAISEHGFYKFLEEFLDLKLPMVLSYDNKKIKLYLQNIFSAFFIEQIGGWSDLLETIPGYYGIIHPKRRTLEFILGLDYYKILVKKAELSTKKKKEIEELAKKYALTKALEKKYFLSIDNLTENYKEYDTNKIKIYVQKNNNELISIKQHLNELKNKMEKLNSLNKLKQTSNQKIDEYIDEIEKIQNDLIINQMFTKQSQEELFTLNYQEKSTTSEKDKIIKEIENLKDIEKLNKLGSEQKIELENCPYCNSKLSESLYPLSFQVMTVEENLKYLEEKNKLLILTLNIISEKIDVEKRKLTVLEKEREKLFDKLKVLNSNLPEIALQKALYREEILLEEEIKLLTNTQLELTENLKEMEYIVKKIKTYDEELEEFPKDNFTVKDKEKLNIFYQDIVKNLKLLEITTNNFQQIKLSAETYFPTIENFNIKLHISASDFIRLEWSYYISLVENSIFKKNILLFDEPAQQNIDIKSIKKLFNILNNMSDTQSIISYAVSKESEKEMIEFFNKNKIEYILINNASIVKEKI